MENKGVLFVFLATAISPDGRRYGIFGGRPGTKEWTKFVKDVFNTKKSEILGSINQSGLLHIAEITGITADSHSALFSIKARRPKREYTEEQLAVFRQVFSVALKTHMDGATTEILDQTTKLEVNITNICP